MRALFRPFALHAAYTPIETIVFFSIIGTLAYFHILNAIKHSAFLDPTGAGNVYAPPVTKPAHVLFKLGEWVGVREKTWLKSTAAASGTLVELQQIVYTLDGVSKMKGTEVGLLLLTIGFSLMSRPDIRLPLISPLIIHNQPVPPPDN